MDVLSKFVDMAMTQEEKKESLPVIGGNSGQPIYPYGLCISLTEKELEKLKMPDDANVGDLIHLHALGKVTSVSKRDTESGTCCRIEIQLTHVAAEDEGDENEEAEASMPSPSYKKMYTEGY